MIGWRSKTERSNDDNTSMLAGIFIARVSTVPFFVVTQLKNQIKMLSDLGSKVTIVCSDGPDITNLNGLSGISCLVIDIPRSISPLRDALALIRLFIFFKRQNIQIAHSTTPKAGLLTAVAAFLAGVPIRLHTFTGQPWVHMVGLKKWLARSSDKLVGILNTRCYADSQSQREFLIEQGLVARQRLFVIGSGSLAGVDTKRFNKGSFSKGDCIKMRQELGIPNDASVILFIGRITDDKGVRDLMTAFSLIEKYENYPHLVFVGPFDDNGDVSKDELLNMSNVHVVGYSTCPEAYLAIADMLCLPSYREGFGTVVIEAAAMSVPTIGTNIYGLSDAIIDGETGILVPIRNPRELAKAIETLLTNDQLRLQMGNAAKLRAQAEFDARIVNNLVGEEYCLLLKEYPVLK